jgi:hypothetical protein
MNPIEDESDQGKYDQGKYDQDESDQGKYDQGKYDPDDIEYDQTDITIAMAFMAIFALPFVAIASAKQALKKILRKE